MSGIARAVRCAGSLASMVVATLSWQQSAAMAQSLKNLPLMDSTAGAGETARFGLGTVVSDEGHILTSLHVVRGCSVVRFARINERQHLASVIGTDDNNDLALLRTVRRDLPVASFRTYPPVKEGEFVRFAATAGKADAVPPPFPVSRALAVSRMGAQRDVRLFAISSQIIGERRQVQAGDSGGPVFDESGAVVGIVTGSLPYSKELRLRHLKGLGYILHSAIGMLFLKAYNVPVRTNGDITPVSGHEPSTPDVLSRIEPAGGGDPTAAEAQRVTVRIWCRPS